MNSGIDEFLDHVDEWKLKLHADIKDLSPAQRKAFWKRLHDEARARGLNVVQPPKAAKPSSRRVRRTG